MGYNLEAAENDQNDGPTKFFLPSESCLAERENHSYVFEMEDMSSLGAHSEQDEESLSLVSDSDRSDKAVGYRDTDSVEPHMLYTRDEEATVIRVFDRRLVSFIALLYMLSFLDRSSTSCLHPWICY